MQQNQNAKRITNVPEMMPMTSAKSPAGMVLMLKASTGTILGANSPSDTKPAVVYPEKHGDQQQTSIQGQLKYAPAGPTLTNMPGRVGGDGSLLVISR